MGSFDIDSLLRFTPAQYRCENCYALWTDMPYDWNSCVVRCETCGVEYVPSQPNALASESRTYFDTDLIMRKIQFNDAIEHSTQLAKIAHDMRHAGANDYMPYVPMRALMDALGQAKQFVHFVTYGMSLQMVGVLRMTARRVPVRGIVSNAGAAIVEEFKDYANESPNLEVKVIERSDRRDDWSTMPHHKVIIIDGLLAFKGSANLTVDGWRKAAKGLDSVEPITDVNEVIEANNRQFSAVWSRGKEVKQILFSEDVSAFAF